MGPSHDQAAHGRASKTPLSQADYPYNDELLLSESDRQAARRIYPNIYPALDFPELREVFCQYDPPTNAAKRWSRIWGFVAVGSVSVSLIVASLERYFADQPYESYLAVGSAALGLFGIVVGLFGVLFASSKRKWLCGRLLTERLRQLHFQALISLAPDLLAAARTGDWTDYADKRKSLLDTVRADVEPRLGLILDDMVESEDAETVSDHLCWLTKPEAQGDLDAEPHLTEFVHFYRRLRIERQIDYCRLKLRRGGNPFGDAPKAQAAFYANLTLICILTLVGVHVVMLFVPGLKFHVPGGKGKDDTAWAAAAGHSFAVVLAILTLAARTLEEGLQPKREIERYRNYKSGVENIAARFDRATGVGEQFAAMRELEEASFDEMVSFLKSNAEAKFVM